MCVCIKLYTVQEIADDVDIDLFRKIAKSHHCVHSLSFLLLNLATTTYVPKDINTTKM